MRTLASLVSPLVCSPAGGGEGACQHSPCPSWESMSIPCTAVLSSLSSPTGSFCWLGKCPKMASHSCGPGQRSRPELVIISPTGKPWTYQSIFFLRNRYPHPSQALGANIWEMICCSGPKQGWEIAEDFLSLQTASVSLPPQRSHPLSGSHCCVVNHPQT